MQAAGTPGDTVRLERARVLGREVHEALSDVPTGVATLTNRMMPLLFPTGDERGVTAVIDHSLRLMQPQPAAPHRGPRQFTGQRSPSQQTAVTTTRVRKKRVLVVFSDLDSDFFSLEGTLRLLRAQRIEPFLVRVAAPGEQIFDAAGHPNAYVSVSTVSVDGLRRARWHAFEEYESARLVSEIRDYLGQGPVGAIGLVESQRNSRRGSRSWPWCSRPCSCCRPSARDSLQPSNLDGCPPHRPASDVTAAQATGAVREPKDVDRGLRAGGPEDRQRAAGPGKMPVPLTTATDTAPSPAALSGPRAVIVPPGSFATVFRFALLALVSVRVPRSEPTTFRLSELP